MKISAGNSKKSSESIGLKPLEINGVTAVTLGTIAWAIAFIAVFIFRQELYANEKSNWLWICASGVGLGVLGYKYTKNRIKRISNHEQQKLIQDFE